ncbi:proto-oncogene tyrosine-protein kinase receptor Ret [Procambarus clarkii]|uniref:proto-oncogene tyrosine-protein kinase receptor Ret n=1 Tax=Procambarus clarkii TaxID=6728 RepID=UPI003743B9BD
MPGVESGREELMTTVDRLEVRPTQSLDRERREDTLPFTVTCTIQGSERQLAPQTRNGTLFILDEDDSPPIRTRNPFVEWHYGTDFEDLDDQLMVLDPDMYTTNNYHIELLGNTHNLVIIESSTKFEVKKELCVMEAENVTGVSITASCTLLTPVMSFDHTRLRGNLPSKVQFSVVFVDRTLVPPDRNRSKQVQYDVTLTLPDDKERYVTPAPANKVARPGVNCELCADSLSEVSCEACLEYMALLTLTPPVELNITLTPTASKYSRLGQLIFPNVSLSDLKNHHPACVTFTLAPDSVGVGVGVTPITGILYVTDPSRLRTGDITVVRGNSSTLVTLSVEDPVVSPCSNQTTSREAWCSHASYAATCLSSCGLGAVLSCWWRPLVTKPGEILARHYATCSPDLDTCPNGICDELELLNSGICPQDCVDESWKRGHSMTISSGGYGIEAGFGVCSCDATGCSCFAAPVEVPPSTPEVDIPFMEPTHKPAWECGSGCKAGVSVAALAFLAFTLACVVFCRRRASRQDKQKGGVISLGSLPSEERSSSLPYNTRDESHDSVIHGIRASPRPDHSLVPALNLTVSPQIDRRWEFPRSRLVIEQTLGEGEFGKVMKAKAQGIGGNLGYTTVAVKMLKSNSTQVELQDLLSEYSLLKEVCHPNVVKLLGACTGKGGPIYIIIEFCQYGSLRNYLKRSRHAEFENRVGSGPVDGSAGDYTITPKDLLSFAWQICKGMAYLTDMKLVHRDLAARNVLLAGGKVCKISDFGLTRDVYEGDLYFKRSKGRVPVKWMALESLVDHVYTSKSDVWGFGVLLWELVTLGTPPYPGVTPERLFSLLKAGYRMEKPENCSQELYDVMLQCWAEEPARRPCFQELTDIFDAMIQADVEYLELRSLIVTNRGYFDGVPARLYPEAPPQFQDAPQATGDSHLPQSQPHVVLPPPPQEVLPQQLLQGVPHLSVEEGRVPHPQQDWSPPEDEQLDTDAYLVARTHLGPPHREESTEPLLAPTSPPTTAAHTPTITTSHAHNPAYSPTSELPPPPLHYSTLATRPDEEDAHNLECCRSEEDSDSGRATGDSGYATEEGRGRWRVEHKGGGRTPQASPRGSSYSPVPRHEHDPEDDQDTSEDLEERQELLMEDLLGHLTPSPEPAQAAHSAAHSSHAAHSTHTTPVIV